jgi:integrase
MTLRFDIRSKKLPGGRLSLSARTHSKHEFRAREVALRACIEAGRTDIIAALKSRMIRIGDLEKAYREGRLDSLLFTNGAAPEPLTLGTQVEKLLATVKATQAEGTFAQYEQMCRQIVERFGAETPMKLIRSDAIQTWLHEPKQPKAYPAPKLPRRTPRKHVVSKPWSPATQQLALAIFGRLFNVTIAKEDEAADAENRVARIRKNPVRNVAKPNQRKPRIGFLLPREWRTLSARVEDKPVHVLLALGVLAGLRIGECAHLRMDVDVVLGEKPYIEVQSRAGKYPWKTKTKRSQRRVPIGSELLRILQRHIELGYCGERYLIITPGKDQPVSRQVLARWTKGAFEAAGIRYGREHDALTHHSCRHSFISWLVQRDVSLMKISQLSGTSVPMILNVYGHLMDSDLASAVAIVDNVALDFRS